MGASRVSADNIRYRISYEARNRLKVLGELIEPLFVGVDYTFKGGQPASCTRRVPKEGGIASYRGPKVKPALPEDYWPV